MELFSPFKHPKPKIMNCTKPFLTVVALAGLLTGCVGTGPNTQQGAVGGAAAAPSAVAPAATGARPPPPKATPKAKTDAQASAQPLASPAAVDTSAQFDLPHSRRMPARRCRGGWCQRSPRGDSHPCPRPSFFCRTRGVTNAFACTCPARHLGEPRRGSKPPSDRRRCRFERGGAAP